MNIEEMIWNGASEEEINKALAEIRAEKTRQEEELAKAAQEKKNKEALKAEGRAYLINAIIAYSSAFDAGEEFTDEDIANLEETVKRVEDMIPLYLKLAELQNEMGKDLDGFTFGLGGLM